MVFNASATRYAPMELLEQWKRGWRPEPLGSWPEIRDKITACLPEFEWPEPLSQEQVELYRRVTFDGCGREFTPSNTGMYRGDFTLEITEPSEHPVLYLTINVRRGAGGNPIPTLTHLAKTCGWALMDMSAGEWIDLEKTTCAGWDGFINSCDQPLSEPEAGEG